MIEKWIAEINPHEMALRIAEASIGYKRPAGKDAEECMKEIIAVDELIGRSFYRGAEAAGKYLEEAINKYQRVQ